MKSDLSLKHEMITDLFPHLSGEEAWEKYKLSKEQVEFFNENGYLPGIKLLEENQVNQLIQELDAIKEPTHPGHELFYEFHSNESKDPNAVLFHSLGHWRMTAGVHDV